MRAHLLEQAGDTAAAVAEFRAAARRASNLREQQYLTTQAARLTHDGRQHDVQATQAGQDAQAAQAAQAGETEAR